MRRLLIVALVALSLAPAASAQPTRSASLSVAAASPVYCWTTWAHPGVYGFFQGADGEEWGPLGINLRPGVCTSLHKLRKGWEPDFDHRRDTAARALYTFSHEQGHASLYPDASYRDELLADAYAMRNYVRVSVRLGVSRPFARTLRSYLSY